jgi:hypothetical protein
MIIKSLLDSCAVLLLLFLPFFEVAYSETANVLFSSHNAADQTVLAEA